MSKISKFLPTRFSKLQVEIINHEEAFSTSILRLLVNCTNIFAGTMDARLALLIAIESIR